ncbi:MAG: Arc family DNA-binding protein [Planctomycetes bacterium]|nr:Arc family DNA-binding protein [Planctomycetota bacterium]
MAGSDDTRAPPAGEDPGGSAAKKPFLLRLPEPLMAELRGWAGQELRSLNGHIEYLLREAVKRRKSGSDSAE